MPPCCRTVGSLTYGRHHRQPVLWNPASPGQLHQPRPAGGLLLQRSDPAQGRASSSWRAGHAGVDNFGLKSAFQFDQGDQAVDPVGGHAERALVPDAHDLGQRADPRHLGRRHRGRAQPDPGGVRSGTEHVACADRGGQERALLPDDVPGAGRHGLPRGTGARAPPSSTRPGRAEWTSGPTRLFGYRDYGSAVMYDAGKILVVGGGGSPTASAEMIDLAGDAHVEPRRRDVRGAAADQRDAAGGRHGAGDGRDQRERLQQRTDQSARSWPRSCGTRPARASGRSSPA